MSPVLANDILNFAYESEKPAYKATLKGVAQALHVRPVYLERQPRAQRHASMIQILSRPGLEAVCRQASRLTLPGLPCRDVAKGKPGGDGRRFCSPSN